MKKYFAMIALGSLSISQAAQNPTLLAPQSSLMDKTVALEEDDEVRRIDQLIRHTESQLEKQKQLRVLMAQFKRQRDEFVQGKQTKAHAGKMVRTARQIYEMIMASHLDHLFTEDFIEELAFFSSIAGKTAVTRP